MHIYGEGSLRNELEIEISRLGLTNKVCLKGNNGKVLDRIKDSYLFILSSKYEGLPNALAEAMLIGIPCISTDCSPGGARMIIDNGINGLIVKNELNALIEAMDYAYDNPAQLIIFSQNSVKWRTRFDRKMVANEWLRFVKELVNDEQ